MIVSKTEDKMNNVCDLQYLREMMNGKKHLIKEIMDVFLKQIPEELKSIGQAVADQDYVIVRRVAHSMKSSVSIMGISLLTPVLREMEDLTAATGPDVYREGKIKELSEKLNLICVRAISEIEKERENYL